MSAGFSDAMIDSMPGVLYLYDEQRQFLRWNQNFEVLSGYIGAEISTMSPLDFIAEDHRALVAGRIQEVFASGDAFVEADFLAKDGTRTPYFFTSSKVAFTGQSCLVGMGLDISTRKQAEAARVVSEARYRALFERSPIGILIADRQSNYIDANPAICELLGYSTDELVGLHASDIVVHDRCRRSRRARHHSRAQRLPA